MSRRHRGQRAGVFISHAGVNLAVAEQVEVALDAAGFDPWLDRSDIRAGALLGKQLRQAIEASRAVVLVWSKAAAASPWVATEVLTAFHLDRYIVPCVLGATELPQFLSRSVYFDLRKRRVDTLARLGEQVRRAPRSRNEFPGMTSYQSPELLRASRALDEAQRAIGAQVDREALAEAKRLQAELNPRMRAAERRWRFDPMILNLAGYHRKNAYMLKHWEEYSAGRFPKDPILDEGRTRFFATLFANPDDYSALNGLGNILLFSGELAAAEFFSASAVRCAARDGVVYREAKDDLAMIRRRTRGSRRGRMRYK